MFHIRSPLTRFRGILNSLQAGCSKNCNQARTDDSQLPWDTDREYGGWGGCEIPDAWVSGDQLPILFIHGNRRDACDWLRHRATFLDAGLSKQNLWAITFRQRTPSHVEMAAQIDDFVEKLKSHTNAPRIHIVAHSLGVTGTRYWLEEYSRYESVNTFVAISGANHGIARCTSIARAGLSTGWLQPCSFLRGDHDRFDDHPLTKLNEESETPGDVTYYTLRGANDMLFKGSEESPELDGAEENRVLETTHDGARESEKAIESIYEWTVRDSLN